jgi:chromosome segregation ATPase
MIDSPEATESAPPKQMRNPSSPVIDPPPTPEKKRFPMPKTAFVIVLLLVVGASVCYSELQRLNVKIKLREIENSRLESELAESKNALQLVGEERNKAEQERDEVRQQRDATSRQLAEMKEKLKETEAQRDAARKDADAGLKAENDVLKANEEKYRETIRKVKEAIDSFGE